LKGCLGSRRYSLSLTLSYYSQDAKNHAIRLGHVAGNEFNVAVHELQYELGVTRQSVKLCND
jgi:tRNA(Glu) U13 pseudouridine synthase TruD